MELFDYFSRHEVAGQRFDGLMHQFSATVSGEVVDSCDFFDSVPEGADVYILKWILHNWPDDRCAKNLGNCRRRMADGGLLVIVDHLVPERTTTSTPGVMWDLHMLLMLDGRERTELQFKELLHRAGFELKRAEPMPSGMGIVEASPA